ncbi:MAG: LSM domain-containing protein [Nanoarchaeota archaeon]|jgi:small nuclear ribonucleoprotein (snRNP)-like protein
MNAKKPYDFLNEKRGNKITITLKDGSKIEGKLISYDLHVNLLIEKDGKEVFVRGDSIMTVE